MAYICRVSVHDLKGDTTHIKLYMCVSRDNVKDVIQKYLEEYPLDTTIPSYIKTELTELE